MTEKRIEELRKTYPEGTKLRLISMDDKQAPQPGTIGTVDFIDDVGTIHMRWKTGSSLGLIPGTDMFEVVKEEEEWLEKVKKITDKLGFSVGGNPDENDFDFMISSPCGQDCSIEIHATTLDELVSKLYTWYDNYDVSYEAYLWLDHEGHGTNGAPYDMKDVYEDMEWFMLKGKALWLELNELVKEEK